MEGIVKGERHPLAHEKGGFRLQDPDNLIPEASKEMMKKVGSKLLKMKFFDLMKISAPAKIAAPLTYLDCFLNDYTYFPKYMAEVVKISDPVERVKYITTSILAGLHVGAWVLQAMSPLNPVLGQTCQRYAPDGTKYFAEQITHHPPISAGVMEGPEGKWRFEVIQEFKANLNGHNSVKAHKEGAIVITLFDGTQYIIEEGWIQLDGIVYGEMVVNVCDKIVVQDLTNNIEAEVIFDPDNKDGAMSKIGSKLKFWGSKKKKRPTDHFDIIITEDNGDKRKKVWTGKGSYLEHIEFEGEKYWEIGEEWGEWIKPDEEHLLSSDSSLRPDLNFLKEKDYENAQKAKEEIENSQRDDRTLREEGSKK